MAHDIHQQENQLVSREAQTLGSYDFHHCWRAVSRPLDTRTFGVHNGCIYGVGNGKWYRPRLWYGPSIIYVWVLVWANFDLRLRGLWRIFFQTGLKVAPLQAVHHGVCGMLSHSSRTFGLVLSDLNGAIKTFCRPKARFALPLLDRLDWALKILPHRSHANHGSHSLEP